MHSIGSPYLLQCLLPFHFSTLYALFFFAYRDGRVGEMKWSLAKFVLLITAAAVAVGPVRGQKYRDELQRDGVQPAKITLHSCERAFKHADPSHTLCWRNEHSKLITGTVAKHDQWCTKQIRKFDSNRNVEGKYKMSDCQKLTIHSETAERKI